MYFNDQIFQKFFMQHKHMAYINYSINFYRYQNCHRIHLYSIRPKPATNAIPTPAFSHR